METPRGRQAEVQELLRALGESYPTRLGPLGVICNRFCIYRRQEEGVRLAGLRDAKWIWPSGELLKALSRARSQRQ